MRQKRPVNLNLTTIHFPLPAIISILHRISGVILFVLIPIALWALQQSLVEPDSFYEIRNFFSEPFVKFIVWAFLSAFIYHLFAGTRHLLMDIGFGETLAGGRLSSKIVAVSAAVVIVLLGIWLW